MSTSLFLAWKKNLFSSPFRAKCLDDENEETVDESERTIAAAATESESSEEAPSVEVEFEAPPIVEVEFEAPPIAEVEFEEPPISEVEFEAPPIEEVEFEAPPVVEVEFEEPPVVEVEFEAPPVEEVEFEAPPVVEEFEAPPVVEEFEAPPVVEEFEAPPVVEVEFEAPPVVEVEFEAMPSVEVEVEAPPSVEVEVEAPPSVEVEAPPIVEVEAPPIVEVETPPSVEVEAPPIEVKAPPTVEVKAPPSVEVKAPPSVKVKAPPSAGAAKAPPGDGVVKEFTGPIMSYVTSAQLAATACARFCPSKEPPPKEPPKEPVEEKEYSCEYGDAKYYALCAFGGLLSCGLTHTAVVPLDMVKCRIQVNPAKYKGIINGFRVTMAEEGTRALAKGWAPTFFGYSMQGVGKFGFYEAFKILYGNMLGEENSYLWRTSLYLAASASAEFFADIALCPMEAVKVRIQTQPGWSTTLREGAPRIFKEEGLTGFYKGLVPLWARQIPYTMMKFACFERTVEALYKHVVPKPRSECSKAEQLVVTFAAGYIAGVFCAVVSHPADTIVSKLNQAKGSNFVQVAKNLGFMGMWKGLFPRIIMIGTLTALQWFIYDSVKVAFRLPRPPPPEMPESLKKRLECEEDD